MGSENLIGPGSYSFPQNITFDLHDIVAILLRERLLSDTRFQRSKLFEVSDGAWPASCLPRDIQEEWFLEMPAPKVGYFLKELEIKDENPSIIEPHNFLHPKFRSSRELDVEEVERIFWRVRNFDSGFLLHHALQLVLDYLPKSATLRIRTSEGHSLMCAPQSFGIGEVDVLPRVLMYINNSHPCTIVDGAPQVLSDQYVFGERYNGTPWVYLIFGADGASLEARGNPDDYVAVDINSLVLGMRGLGAELYSVERLGTYHNKVLPRGADRDMEIVHSPRISAISPEKAMPAKELAKRVLSRLERIARGEEMYCAYCGTDAPKSQCSECRRKSKFCGQSCQKKAWPYHKKWCRVDAAAKDEPKPDGDIEMGA